MLTDDEKNTLDTYNNIAPEWVSKNHILDFWSSEYQVFQSFLPAGKIIDLGCGGGRDSVWFKNSGYGYVGIDISEAMIAEARKRHPGTEFLQGDLYNLNFTENSFDGFWSACSLVHIPKDRIDVVLNNVKNILKPEAIGFIAVKQGKDQGVKKWQNSGQKRFFVFYEQDEFSRILTDAGFKILKTSVREPGKYDQDGIFLVYYVQLI